MADSKEEKLALLIGMFAGDGCLPIKHNGQGDRNYQIAFYNTDKELVLLFRSLFFQLFGINGKIFYSDRLNKKRLWHFEKYGKELAVRFNQEFEMPFGKKALSVFIPMFIKNSGYDIQKNFFFWIADYRWMY